MSTISVKLEYPALPYLTAIRNEYFSRHKRFPRMVVVDSSDGAKLLQEQPLLRNWGMMWHGMQILVAEQFDLPKPEVPHMAEQLNPEQATVIPADAPPLVVNKVPVVPKKRPGRKPMKK